MRGNFPIPRTGTRARTEKALQINCLSQISTRFVGGLRLTNRSRMAIGEGTKIRSAQAHAREGVAQQQQQGWQRHPLATESLTVGQFGGLA
jgi:hypothetical protein